jgi:hypothetical protein
MRIEASQLLFHKNMKNTTFNQNRIQKNNRFIMKKSIFLNILMLSLSITGCGGGENGMGSNENNQAGLQNSTSNLISQINTLPEETLSTAEKDSLIYVREEEKLALDVYQQLNIRWGNQTKVFENISNSEKTHIETVQTLFFRYKLVDVAANNQAGLFINSDLQNLYTELITEGSISLVDGFKVGAAIEEVDILDISKHLDGIDNQDIRLAYQNLLKGSRNHLRSFYKNIQKYGGIYTPRYLNEETFNGIIHSEMEK